jgi:prepilin-type N-terminal cleavage/methylation domain-containing protein
MNAARHNATPHARRAARAAARGFSLIEMMVALGVLVVAMAVVSNIFALTARTAGTAVAISELQARARDFELNLQRDFAAINPAESFLMLVGETQAAALTDGELEAGRYHRVLVGDPTAVPNNYDPRYANIADPEDDQYSDLRTDLMMFVTQRPSVSRAPATATGGLGAFQESLQGGMRVSPVLAVYGHAAFANAKPKPAGGFVWPNPGSERHIFTGNSGDRTQLSPIPASQWHLSRRALLVENRLPTGTTPPDTLPLMRWNRSAGEALALKQSQPLSDYAGDSIDLHLDRILEQFSPNPSAGVLGVPGGNGPLATENPYVFSNWPGAMRNLLWDLLYLGGGNNPDRHIATVIENPPPELSANLSVQGISGCAWFQVEFLMPEDPRNSVDHPIADQRDDMPHWVELTPGQTYVFVPDTAENRALVAGQVDAGGAPDVGTRLSLFGRVIPKGYVDLNTAANRKIRMWPYAIRVTMHLYDPQGRLDAPIVRSVVHRFN